MKYNVTYSCGHTETLSLGGKTEERERRIKWLEESGLCAECYAKKMSERIPDGCEVVEMLYRDYKNEYADCKTKKDSYNPETKTVIVYVPTADPEDYEYLVSKYGEEEAEKAITEARQIWGADMRANLHENVAALKSEEEDQTPETRISEIEHEITELGMDAETLNSCDFDTLSDKYGEIQTIRERIWNDHYALLSSDKDRFFAEEKEYNTIIALINYYQELINDVKHNRFFTKIPRAKNEILRQRYLEMPRHRSAKAYEDYQTALAELKKGE